MARVKTTVSRQDVDGEPARAQRQAEVATTSTSPSAPADHGKRSPHTASYLKEKQQPTHTSSVRGRPFLGGRWRPRHLMSPWGAGVVARSGDGGEDDDDRWRKRDTVRGALSGGGETPADCGQRRERALRRMRGERRGATTRWRIVGLIGGVTSMKLNDMMDSNGSNICCEDVALAYIDGRRQMVCSSLGDLGGAQLVTEEPSLSRRSPALQIKTGVWPWASMALGGYGLGSSFITHYLPLRIASISKTKF
ncbi:hypothetical protein Scep_028022 [Stephania cephalantha]|uniref:Uncharacterized protein n=1 Tax=Stephania cephalantha TaxID=152367 RepID=A0AAP0EBC6_9MAGN